MDGVNIVFALENEFDINVPDEEVKSIRSVRDMVEGVRTLVEQRSLQATPRAILRPPHPDAQSGRHRDRSHLRGGNNREAFQKALQEGRCGVGPITNTECLDLRFRNGSEVKGYDPNDHFTPKEADMIDRFAQFAVVAAREAVGRAASSGHRICAKAPPS